MREYFKQFTTHQLYDLRDHINCSPEYGIDTKQQLMDEITSEIHTRSLVELMRPIAKDYLERGLND